MLFIYSLLFILILLFIIILENVRKRVGKTHPSNNTSIFVQIFPQSSQIKVNNFNCENHYFSFENFVSPMHNQITHSFQNHLKSWSILTLFLLFIGIKSSLKNEYGITSLFTYWFILHSFWYIKSTFIHFLASNVELCKVTLFCRLTIHYLII